jgi:hypothetical protein
MESSGPELILLLRGNRESSGELPEGSGSFALLLQENGPSARNPAIQAGAYLRIARWERCTVLKGTGTPLPGVSRGGAWDTTTAPLEGLAICTSRLASAVSTRQTRSALNPRSWTRSGADLGA